MVPTCCSLGAFPKRCRISFRYKTMNKNSAFNCYGDDPIAGEQNSLTPLIKHQFTRMANSCTIGPFGNIKTRDMICIVGLDGSLSFFDQDTFLFLYIFQDVLIPGPVCYIENCDSFVICKSTWVLEIYRWNDFFL